ncbi:hypothetical protein PAXRUDRAFT_831334 [Paxillus rubicundulus Ve08.2h10]|uniref:Unplaced genomic scaffold scaffold_644, whole genome shotgun sequence n=1 Tax=Paxillus rubicundulus Ve08.2h10 TaxID=930991 RepID=A0A0D0DX50_9AGAM|nr:hypothetical protein PAXRUDRAFT_831334 [Paxillus rubicundulus Ve08.2h10]
MLVIATHTLEWALQKEPLKRHIRPAGATPSTTMDAFDLAVNLRGIGWDWSKGLRVPRETHLSTHVRFVAYTIFSASLHAFIRGVPHSAVQSFSPDAFSSIIGGTIFDKTLPFFLRYLCSSIIATLIASGMYCYCFFQMAMHRTCSPHSETRPRPMASRFRTPVKFATSVSDFWDGDGPVLVLAEKVSEE